LSGKMNIGIIGYGGFGQFLDNAWKDLPVACVTAISDASKDIRIPPEYMFYNHPHDLFDDRSIDIVAIATPPSTHHEIACEALRSGKHVFIEKPLAVNVAHGKEILGVARECGKRVIVDFLMRYNPLIYSIFLLHNKGVLGTFRRFLVENYAQDELLPLSHWFWDRKISGGILIEHAVHFIDIVHMLNRSGIAMVNGLMHSTHESRENEVMANILYEDGLIATHYHAFTRPGIFEETMMRFVFDLATIELYGWIPLQGKMNLMTSQQHRKLLFTLPGLRIKSERELDDISDDSRPDGWGNLEESNNAGGERTISSGGVKYRIDRKLEVEFGNIGSKASIYSECVRNVMMDFIKSIQDASYKSRINADDGLRSLQVADMVTKKIEPK